jgi:hypothetical protein
MDSDTFASESASGGMRLERPGVRSISPSSAGSTWLARDPIVGTATDVVGAQRHLHAAHLPRAVW